MKDDDAFVVVCEHTRARARGKLSPVTGTPKRLQGERARTSHVITRSNSIDTLDRSFEIACACVRVRFNAVSPSVLCSCRRRESRCAAVL